MHPAWLRESYRRDRCTVLSPWSLGWQKWAAWAEKPQKTQGNTWVITKLFENSLSTAACSQAQIILNPLVSVSQGPLHICPLQEKADFQVLKPPGALPQPCRVSKALDCPGRSLSLRILKQIYKTMWPKSSLGTWLLQAVRMEKPPCAQRWRQKALQVCYLASLS